MKCLLRIENTIFTSESADVSVVIWLDSTKTQVNERAYFRFECGSHPDLCALEKILCLLKALKKRSVTSGQLFPAIFRNRIQGGRELSPDSHVETLRLLGSTYGFSWRLQDYSARRGGIGYECFVLRKDMLYLYRA